MKEHDLSDGMQPGEVREYALNDFCKAFVEVKDNCWSYSVFAQDPNVSIFENEFRAGFVQAKVQGKRAIGAARDNVWRNFLLLGTPQQSLSIDIPDGALEIAEKSLYNNYKYLYNYIKEHGDERIPKDIKRLMFRMAGIAAGVKYDNIPEKVSYEDLDIDKMEAAERKLGGYCDEKITFMDIYFINAEMDMFDVISDKINLNPGEQHKKKAGSCSAYVRFMPDGEIYWTHNSWSGFYAQSCAVTYTIGDDFVTLNAYSQGEFGSNTDFGFNKHGIGFNETTHLFDYDKPKELGLWLTWRSAAAEMFATSIQDFYDYVSIDNTGTYLNGYQLIDAYRNQIGLIDMSYDRFALFVSDGKTLKVTDSTGYVPTEKDYDPHLITPVHIFGVNFPVYRIIAYELGSMDVRPMRRVQFFNHIDSVVDMESCKDLIVYTDPLEPLSIYGRWDLGYGTTEMKFLIEDELIFRTRPDGSLDGCAFSASQVRAVLDGLQYKPNKDSKKTSFWMKYGTPTFQGEPFIWSKSRFAKFKGPQEKDFVPDAVAGAWNLIPMFMD